MYRHPTFQQRLRMLGYPSYAAYLRSPHWQQVRRAYWAGAGPSPHCAVCERTDALQLHHRTYRRLGRERLDDLVLLCADHHRAVHQAVRGVRTKLDARAAAVAGTMSYQRAIHLAGTIEAERAQNVQSTRRNARAEVSAGTIRSARATLSGGTIDATRAELSAGTMFAARAENEASTGRNQRASGPARTSARKRAAKSERTIHQARPGPLWTFAFPGGLALPALTSPS